MSCLYCGKHLPFLRKLTGGGEFCSDGHKNKYHEEYNQLAVSRLLQAQSRPDEAKPGKKPEPAPPVAIPVPPSDGPDETALEVVAYANEFQRLAVSPVAGTATSKPLEFEPLPTASAPALASLLAPTSSQPPDEAGFLNTYPAPRRVTPASLEIASDISLGTPAEPVLPGSQAAPGELPRADEILCGSRPTPRMGPANALSVSVTVVELAGPKPAIFMRKVSPRVTELPLAAKVHLTLSPIAPEDGKIEMQSILWFAGLLELHPPFDSRLTLLDPNAQTQTEPVPVRLDERTEPTQTAVKQEFSQITPRSVLDVLARLHRSPSPKEEQPPAPRLLKPVSVAPLAPSPAVLAAGFGTLPLAAKPRIVLDITLPLRPKMTIGNASGPRASGIVGRPLRSMLHLEEDTSRATDADVEPSTLFGKLGGLFGKKHKTHKDTSEIK